MTRMIAAPASNITFIGGGNMARSLIGGLVARGQPAGIDPRRRTVRATARSAGARFRRARACRQRRRGRRRCAIWVFAVKPQVLRAVCRSAGAAGAGTAAAGRSPSPPASPATQLERWLGGDLAGGARDAQHARAARRRRDRPVRQRARRCRRNAQLAERLLAATGLTAWIDDEAQMDAVTARVRQRPGLCLPAGRSDAGRRRSARPGGRRRAHAGAADHPRRRAHAGRIRRTGRRAAPARHLARRHHAGGDRELSRPAAFANWWRPRSPRRPGAAASCRPPTRRPTHEPAAGPPRPGQRRHRRLRPTVRRAAASNACAWANGWPAPGMTSTPS